MPFIQTKTNISIPREKELLLKKGLGEIIALFPGKSERWLMLDFSEKCHLWFAGSDGQPIAMVEVQLFGQADNTTCDGVTARICDLFQTVLGISPDHVYVNYTFSKSWGWNGGNF